jgi:hypothetical protein
MENHGEKHGPTVGELIPQDHGGALRYGGTNKGGTGRPASAIRAACRNAFEESIPAIEAIANDPEASTADRLKAMDMLGKYGLGSRTDITSDDKPVPTMTMAERVERIRAKLREASQLQGASNDASARN